MSRKRGKFSLEELEYIDNNSNVLSAEVIAEHLNRSVDVVAKHIDEIKDKKNGVLQRVQEKNASRDLRSKPYWAEIKQQYSERELELYQYHWAKYIEQFNDDITHSEESQICKAIDLEILMARILKEKYKIESELSIFERDLLKELNRDESLRDNNLIQAIQLQLQSYRASQTSKTKEYNELLDKHQKMARDLKTTRDQRFKEIQERKITFFGWLKTFQDIKERERMSKEAALISLALDKSRQDLSDYHKYEDGTLDQPILSADTIKEDHV